VFSWNSCSRCCRALWDSPTFSFSYIMPETGLSSDERTPSYAAVLSRRKNFKIF
jgi:hypothetical protein